jgi:hypothetical protein
LEKFVLSSTPDDHWQNTGASPDSVPSVTKGAARGLSASNCSDVAGSDLVYRLIDALVDGYFPVIDELADWIDIVQNRNWINISKDVYEHIVRITDIAGTYRDAWLNGRVVGCLARDLPVGRLVVTLDQVGGLATGLSAQCRAR